jgi:hypothetical protein
MFVNEIYIDRGVAEESKQISSEAKVKKILFESQHTTQNLTS